MCAGASRTSSSASCGSPPACPRTCICQLARSAQGAALHGRRVAADGDLRRHGARGQDHRLRQGLRRGLARTTANTSPAAARSSRPWLPNVEPLRVECEHFLELHRARAPRRAPTAPAACASCACSRTLQHSLEANRRWLSASADGDLARRPTSIPARCWRDRVSVGAGSVIEAGAVLGGRVPIGCCTVIHAGARIGARLP